MCGHHTDFSLQGEGKKMGEMGGGEKGGEGSGEGGKGRRREEEGGGGEGRGERGKMWAVTY